MPDEAGLERLVKMLGGWPRHFRAPEKKHGLALLAQLRRDRMVDEIVFGIVIRYAWHRAQYDRLTEEITKAMRADDEQERSSSGGLTLTEQAQFAQFNKLALIEKQLLGTPYERARKGLNLQTSFMDQLEAVPVPEGGDGKVAHFKPLTRPARG